MPTHQDQDEDNRGRLAGVLERRSGDIERRWLKRARAILRRHDLSRTDLRNSMPLYLERLAEGLRQPNIEAAGEASWDTVAREHAEMRVRLGFDIDQVVREFVVLRQILFEVIEEEEGRLLDVRQSARIADLIEGAITAAVKSYVASRDYEVRKRQAEHIGFITHELRNPLTTAMLGTVQLRRTLAPTLASAHERTLVLVERNLRRLSELIDGVLLVERDAHALKPHSSPCPLGQILDEPLASARLAAAAKRLQFETRFDPDVVVQVDPKLTASAVDNVVQNALKYTDAGEVEVLAEDKPNEVVLHVRDSGPGLSREELRTLFEPFHRGHTSKPGTGLGLAIARRAIEAQGGTIHAESDQHKGCHFWLTLPKPRR